MYIRGGEGHKFVDFLSLMKFVILTPPRAMFVGENRPYFERNTYTSTMFPEVSSITLFDFVYLFLILKF